MVWSILYLIASVELTMHSDSLVKSYLNYVSKRSSGRHIERSMLRFLFTNTDGE